MNEQIKFLVTGELGKLAKWLRILGFDTDYRKTDEKSKIIISSLKENRIIVTKNKNIGARKGLRFVHLRSDFFEPQLKQLIKELRLKIDKKSFFKRCVLCNKMLKIVEKEKIKTKVPEYVYNTQKLFHECSNCQKVYWKGTHWGNVGEILDKLDNEDDTDFGKV